LIIGFACLGGGAGREALRAANMTALFLLTTILDFYLALLPSSPRVALPVYQADAVDARREAISERSQQAELYA
jgi:hypothetical protein